MVQNIFCKNYTLFNLCTYFQQKKSPSHIVRTFIDLQFSQILMSSLTNVNIINYQISVQESLIVKQINLMRILDICTHHWKHKVTVCHHNNRLYKLGLAKRQLSCIFRGNISDIVAIISLYVIGCILHTRNVYLYAIHKD